MTALHHLNWRKIRRDLGLVLGSHLAYKISNYVILMVLTRAFAKDQMGEYFFAFSLAASAALLTELGLNHHLVRETARHPRHALDLLGQVLTLRLPLFVVYFAALSSFAVAARPEILPTLLLIAAYVALEELYLTFGSTFVGVQRVHYSVVTGITARSALIVIVLTTVARGGGLHAILAGHVAANVLLVAVAAWLVRTRIGPFRLRRAPGARAALERALPLFALSVLGTLHFNVDTLMLGFLRPYAEVATYDVAFRLLEAAQFLVRPVLIIFLPVCAELALHGRADVLAGLYRRMLLYGTGVGVALALGVLIAAGLVLPLLFGPAYASSAPVLRVLYLAVPALYANAVAGLVARSLDLERRAAAWMAVCVLLNAALNAVSIPLWGPLGAAWASVVSQTVLAGLLLRLNLRRLGQGREAPAVPAAVSAPEVARAT